jgi:tetratricopeptide (TPR) repeat protein
MIGEVLNQRYRLDAELGRGGMGVVYRGHDLLLERDVAVKMISQAGLGTESRVRLLREAQAVAQLNHPNIITLYDAGEAVGATYIVMELLDGHSLYERRPQDLDELVEIGRQVCAALDHAHTHGIIHRDLKPENIIVSGALAPSDGADPTLPGQARDAGLRVKLTDFGLARSVASRLTTEGGLIGTVFYLPPEQALGKELDGRADLYALGVMLYELAACRLPYSGDDPLTVISQHLHAPVVPPTTFNPDIPRPLEALILKLMSKQPEDRPASAAEVGRILERIAHKSTDILAALGAPAELSPLDRLVRGRLVGRDRELIDVKAAWQRATVQPDPESAHVLLISGESGVGKTPLVRELRALAEVSRGRVLAAECYAEGSAPYAPIAHIMREALAEPAGELELSDLVLADLARLAPEIRERFPDLPENPPLGPQAEQQRLLESVACACAALIARGWQTGRGPAESPLLIVVEDIHWADGGTLAVLRHMARRSRTARLRLLLVLTYRESMLDETRSLSELVLDFTRERLATHVKLGHFNRGQTAELLEVMFQQKIPPAFVDSVYAETEGNLFYIEEVCRTLIDEGGLYCSNCSDACWVFPQDLTHTPIPPSVRLAVQARVGKLPPDAQDVLRLAAVIGREFDFDTLRRACDLDEERLIDTLEAAQRAQLIAEVRANGGRGSPRGAARDTFVFAHNLTRATLRESVSGLRRRRLHRRVAEAIETLRPGDDATLAYHYGQAGDDDHARTHYRRAAERARRVYANEEAIRAYTEAIALTPDNNRERFDLLLARAQTYDLVARRGEQHADIAELLHLAEALQDAALRCDALLAQADFYLQTEHLRAKELTQRAAGIARRIGDGVREGHALRRQGFIDRLSHDYAASRTALDAATQRFSAAGLIVEAAACLHILSLTLGDLGEYEAALKASEGALALSRQAGDRRQEGISLRRVAIVHLERLQEAEALPFAEAALALLRAVGDRTEECHALNVLGVIHAWLNHPVESETFFRASLALAEDTDSGTSILFAIENLNFFHYGWRGEYMAAIAFIEAQLSQPFITGNEYIVGNLRVREADFLARLGQFSRALPMFRAELSAAEHRLAEGTLSTVEHVNLLALVGLVEAEIGDHAAARGHLEAALAGIKPAETPPDVAGLLINRAYCALLAADAAELRLGLDLVERAIGLMHRGATWLISLAIAHRVAAELYLALADPDAALAASQEALRDLGVGRYAAEKFYFTHSRALLASGRQAEAEEYLRRAYERVRLVAGQTDDPELRRSWLEDVRTNREIIADWERLHQTD